MRTLKYYILHFQQISSVTEEAETRRHSESEQNRRSRGRNSTNNGEMRRGTDEVWQRNTELRRWSEEPGQGSGVPRRGGGEFRRGNREMRRGYAERRRGNDEMRGGYGSGRGTRGRKQMLDTVSGQRSGNQLDDGTYEKRVELIKKGRGRNSDTIRVKITNWNMKQVCFYEMSSEQCRW